MTITIALTGGIASGKSTVADHFRDLGATVVDADVVARDIVARGSPALAELAATFGAAALTETGELDRRAMRQRIFSNADDRHRLEQILHPRIRAQLHQAAANCDSSYCILAIPLLAETWQDYQWVDRTLVIDVAPEVQIKRVMQRDCVSYVQAVGMLSAQATRAERLALANDAVDNSCSRDILPVIVARLHRRYGILEADVQK